MTKTVLEIRKDLPYLNEEKVGKKVIYLDNAATSQKPQAVIDTITNYYSYQNGSPHRGSHYPVSYTHLCWHLLCCGEESNY